MYPIHESKEEISPLLVSRITASGSVLHDNQQPYICEIFSHLLEQDSKGQISDLSDITPPAPHTQGEDG